MENELNNRFVNLTNALKLFAYKFEALMMLDNVGFDIEFELGSEFEIGLSLENIKLLSSYNLLNHIAKQAILNLRDDIIAIPDLCWTIDELENNFIWIGIRESANRVLDIMNIEDRNYDFSIDTVIDV